MAWIRLDDDYVHHAKFTVLSHQAFRLWHEGMAYCRKMLTDGLIGFTALKSFRYTSKATIKELATPGHPGAAPLWESHPDGYIVHDYLDWNPSSEEDKADRDAAKLRMRAFRGRQKAPAVTPPVTPFVPANVTPFVTPPVTPDVPGSGQGKDLRSLIKKEILEEPRARVYQNTPIIGKNTHLAHAECDPTLSRCVPSQVQHKLMELLAPKFQGDREAAREALKAWYPSVWSSLPDGFVMGEAFRFWQGRFDAFWATDDKPLKQASSLPATDDLLAKVKERLAKEVEQRGRMA